jgi:hypothetical protein
MKDMHRFDKNCLGLLHLWFPIIFFELFSCKIDKSSCEIDKNVSTLIEVPNKFFTIGKIRTLFKKISFASIIHFV